MPSRIQSSSLTLLHSTELQCTARSRPIHQSVQTNPCDCRTTKAKCNWSSTPGSHHSILLISSVKRCILVCYLDHPCWYYQESILLCLSSSIVRWMFSWYSCSHCPCRTTTTMTYSSCYYLDLSSSRNFLPHLVRSLGDQLKFDVENLLDFE